MKKILISVVAIFGIYLGISCATTSGGYAYICSTATRHFFEFPDTADEYTFYSVLDSVSAEEYVFRSGDVTLPFRIIVLTVWTYTEGDSGYTPVWEWEAEDLIDCETIEYVPPSPPPMNECLGVSADYIYTLLGYGPEDLEDIDEDGLPDLVFEVDNILYPFGENLSYLVAQEVVWSWDLYIDGIHLLTFEQTEEMACSIVAEYPQDAD